MKVKLFGTKEEILAQLKDAELDSSQDYVCEISLKRSLSMNDCYNSWCRIIQQEFGDNSLNETKRNLKYEFGLYSEYKDKDGTLVREYESTADFTKEKMMQFISDIETFAIGHGIILPKKDVINFFKK